MKFKYIKLSLVLIFLVLPFVCIGVVKSNDNQATLPVPLEMEFEGEYSYDGVSWYEYSESADISSFDGDVTFRGHFTEEVIEGATLNFFINHIGISVYVNGNMIYMDTPTQLKSMGRDLMKSMCGQKWSNFICPQITAEDEVEIRFINFHNHGNKNAYKEAITNCYMSPQYNPIMENYLEKYIEPFENLGYGILVVGIMLVGVAVFAKIFGSDLAAKVAKIAVSTLFMGGYVLFDVMLVFLMDDSLVVKTYARQMCLMISVFFVGMLICDMLSGIRRKIANVLVAISGVVNAAIIIIAITGKVLMYDMGFAWKIMQLVVSLALVVLGILEIKHNKKNWGEISICILVHLAVILDIGEVGYFEYFNGLFYKTTFIIMLFGLIFRGVRRIVNEHRTNVKNQKLEIELDNSHTALMLSQIKPHFIYNVLGTIREFCEEEPKKAAELVQKFSMYLRGNFTEMDNQTPVSVAKEIEHVKHYVDIEMIRFPDMMVEYDIQNDEFLVPALTIQPLVENAIKHGLMGLETAGKVKVSSYETDKYYEVCVQDDGVGFDESVFYDGKKHIGIANIRRRIEAMCGGNLTIDSVKGQGTTAIIRIPKEGVMD